MTQRRTAHESLFTAAGRRAAAERAPLAERLRPSRLDDLLGQRELLAPGSLLRREVAEGRLGSLLLWGPPGSGKTTLARLLAAEGSHELVAVSAVSAGVPELRAAIAGAEERLAATHRPTLLFVDEIHRFHKGQQDTLLHAVEDGRVTLVGATTENPSFHVNAALLSRCRVVLLRPLDEAAGSALLDRALADGERGLGGRGLQLEADGRAALLDEAGGDARRLLNLLESAAQLAGATGAPATGQRIGAEQVRAARGVRLPAHDKSGDRHYDLLSALHKSLRGSDPDAAAYYVQRLLVAGEDPTVVARRLVRMASEDVGLADPRALGMALDALGAVEFLGLPEGDAALVQAAVYLALAPKSDAVYRACLAARGAVEARGPLPVPIDLRNAPTPLMAELGHGRGYVNPHTAPEAVTAQEHLPDALAGATFYEPGERGAEAELRRRLVEFRRRREAARRVRPEGGPAAPADTSG